MAFDSALVVFQKIISPDSTEYSDANSGVSRNVVIVRRGNSALERAVFGIVDARLCFVDMTRAWPMMSPAPGVAIARPHVAALLDQLVMATAKHEERGPKRPMRTGAPPVVRELGTNVNVSNGPLCTPEGSAFLLVQWVVDDIFQTRVNQMLDEEGIDLSDSEGCDDDEDEEDKDEPKKRCKH